MSFDPTPVPTGPEFRVNTTTGGNQYAPSAATLADGGFVVCWLSDDPICNLTADPKWIYLWGDPEPDKDDGYYTSRDLDLSEANLRAQFPDLTDHGDDFVVTMPVSDGNEIEFAGRRAWSTRYEGNLHAGCVWVGARR